MEKIFKIIATIIVLGIFGVVVWTISPAKVPIWGKALAFVAIAGIWGNKWS